MTRLPVKGGPLDGAELLASGAFAVLEDGSVYRYSYDGWIYCGPRAGVCRGCGGVVLPTAGKSAISCGLCGGPVSLPNPRGLY